jgi:hypothetical protein
MARENTPCRPDLIAECEHGEILLCPGCNTCHLNFGAITIRVHEPVLHDIGLMMIRAITKLESEKQNSLPRLKVVKGDTDTRDM